MPLPVLFIPLFFFVVWYSVLRGLAWLSGWSNLARLYPDVPSAGGQRLRGRWIAVGWVDYNGCVNYQVEEQGLHISLWPMFNFGHPPLFIPWSEVRAEEVRKHFGRRGQIVTLAVGSPVVVRLKVPEAIFPGARNAPPVEG